ncbi:hypothetical protein FLM55_07445 [Francisella sp. Scap27]|uniref:hypothetical protein n=1 Tax=Francisella sp. Scap27 TaxID=2589986 RepID=UPI0015BDA76F|nr:hypothetical protein [Francisella sp. Scap27]QLE79579.1 hypothetical protein FLM55_07445 [Francisella sp. Scap27]
MKKIATIIILIALTSIYFLVFYQKNSVPSCASSDVKPKLNTLVRQILNQTSSQKSIQYKVSDIQETKVYKHSRICKSKLNFKDGTNTSISYAVENNKGKTEVRIIPGG